MVINMRKSGILLPVSSLPSRYGIGCFSKEAYKFIDRLKEAGQAMLAQANQSNQGVLSLLQ